MQIPTGNNVHVELEQIRGLGSPWIVRVYKKRLFFKRLISSDWFLDEAQARRFAEQLAQELTGDGSAEAATTRQPGWTLHRAPR